MTLTTREPGRTREEPAEPAGPEVTQSGLARFRAWLAHAPAERVPLPLIPAIWTATEIMHAAGVRGLFVGVVRRSPPRWPGGWVSAGPERRAPQLAGIEVAAVTAAAGVWVTAGTELGPLAGPDHLLSVLYLAASGGGYWWLRRHDAVGAARARRDEAAAWEARKRRGTGSRPARPEQLPPAGYNDTLLGDEMQIDTRGTGNAPARSTARTSPSGSANWK